MTSDNLVKAKKGRPRGFAPWAPDANSLIIVDAVRQVLADYAAYLPLTNRQVFYRLVATLGYPKEESAYKMLCNKINRAKRAGLLEWSHFRDDGITETHPPGYGSEEEIRDVLASVLNAGINRQVWQPIQQIVICEAAGMVPQLERVADGFGVAVISSSGFDSSTARKALQHKISEYLDAGKDEVIVWHVGDHDPSGQHVYQSLKEDVGAMLDTFGEGATFKRLAVTEDQIAAFNLPEAPAKATDNRTFNGTGTVQAEALPPDVMANILREALERHYDDALASAGEAESARIMRAIAADFAQ